MKLRASKTMVQDKGKKERMMLAHMKTSEYDSTVKEWYISMPLLGESWFDETAITKNLRAWKTILQYQRKKKV